MLPCCDIFCRKVSISLVSIEDINPINATCWPTKIININAIAYMKEVPEKPKGSQWSSLPDRAGFRCSSIKIYFCLKKNDRGRSILDATIGLCCKCFTNKFHENVGKGDDFTFIFLFCPFIRLFLRVFHLFMWAIGLFLCRLIK